MASWFYDKTDLRKSPSALDGIPWETECRYRREGARFIIKVGTVMKLRYDTWATGVVYLHRFYMCHSFKTFPRFVTASCCLFLAGKVEETPKKCKDIIKIARDHLTDQQYSTFGEDPKEMVLTLERILLQTMNFDLQVDHPYNYLLTYAKSLKGDQEVLEKMVQMAWNFTNDSLCTCICLQWEPEVVAIALMFFAGKLSKFEVIDWQGRLPHHKKWWDLYVENITVELLEDICHQVLDLYSMPMPEKPQDSPPPSPAQPIAALTGAPIPTIGGGPQPNVVNPALRPPSAPTTPLSAAIAGSWSGGGVPGQGTQPAFYGAPRGPPPFRFPPQQPQFPVAMAPNNNTAMPPLPPPPPPPPPMMPQMSSAHWENYANNSINQQQQPPPQDHYNFAMHSNLLQGNRHYP